MFKLCSLLPINYEQRISFCSEFVAMFGISIGSTADIFLVHRRYETT